MRLLEELFRAKQASQVEVDRTGQGQLKLPPMNELRHHD